MKTPKINRFWLCSILLAVFPLCAFASGSPTSASPVCTLKLVNNTQLQAPIVLGTTNLSLASYSVITVRNGASDKLSVDCDTLANFAQKAGANQVLTRNTDTSYVMTLSRVDAERAPKIPPISRSVLGIGAQSQLFITSANNICVLPAPLC